MANSKNNPTQRSLLGYLPFAFLWWVAILTVSAFVFGNMFNHGGDYTIEACFTLGWLAVCFGVPTLVHRTWKMPVAMLLVIAAIVAALAVAFLMQFQGGHG